MSAADLRSNLLNELRLLADPERQLAWERREKVAHVPWELINGWFDLYHPETPLFREAFNAAELEQLGRFNAVLQSAIDALPDVSVSAMHQNASWRKVVTAANQALC